MRPGPGVHGSVRVKVLDDDEKQFFRARLDVMMLSDQIEVVGNEVWCWEDEQEDILQELG